MSPATATAVLTIVEHTPGERLVLGPTRTRRRLLRRWLARVFPDRHRAATPMHLAALACDGAAGTIHLVARSGRARGVAVDEIDVVRLRVVETAGVARILELTITFASGDTGLQARFRVADLDRDDEAVDLALRIARCAGLGGYCVRGREPADVELVLEADQGAPFRTSQRWRPVPRDDEPIAYEARAAVEIEAAPEALGEDTIGHWRLANRWQVDHWRAGERIELSRPGLVRGRAFPWVLTRLPAALARTVLFGGLVFVGLALTMAVFGSVVAFVTLSIGDCYGTSGPMEAAVPDVALTAVIICAALALASGGAYAYRKLADAYDEQLSGRRVLDWREGELVENAGGRLRRRTPLSELGGVIAHRTAARDGGLRSVSVALEHPESDRLLCRWSHPTKEVAAQLEDVIDGLEASLTGTRPQ
jgi:hypothetical protein